jgi:V8-like Glu-specific endopeptidase
MNLYLALGTSALSFFLGFAPQRAAVVHLTQQVMAGAVTVEPEAATDSVPIVVNTLAELGIDPEATESFIPENLAVSSNPAEGSRAVLGEDNRVLLTSQSYPWSAIGQISGITPSGNSYICTGSLVAPDIVLTNAHCVMDADTGEIARNIKFKPNLINGLVANTNDIANVRSVLVGTDFSDGHNPHPDDWAFVALDRPLGEQYGTLGLAPLPTETLAGEPFMNNLVMVGYSGDFPTSNPGQSASAHVGCSIVEAWQDVVLHACDTYGGSSGGPILGLVNDEVRIVALNSAEARNRDTGEGIINFAVKIPRIVSQIRALAN